MRVEPYLFFDGRCEEAMNFYKAAVGADITAVHRFKDSPDQTHAIPGGENKIMHANMRIGGTTVMASDGQCTGNAKFDGFSLSIAADSDADAERLFNALSAGGQVTMPMSKTFFASRFGMCADKFGVKWMVLAGQG